MSGRRKYRRNHRSRIGLNGQDFLAFFDQDAMQGHGCRTRSGVLSGNYEAQIHDALGIHGDRDVRSGCGGARESKLEIAILVGLNQTFRIYSARSFSRQHRGGSAGERERILFLYIRGLTLGRSSGHSTVLGAAWVRLAEMHRLTVTRSGAAEVLKGAGVVLQAPRDRAIPVSLIGSSNGIAQK